ncbi:MAG: PKD domain-containing protein [Halobacteria archaeon]
MKNRRIFTVVLLVIMAVSTVGFITLNQGLQMDDEAYITTPQELEQEVPVGGTGQVTVEVRDKFNNPVSGVKVEATPPRNGTVLNTSQVTDTKGRASFIYKNIRNFGEEDLEIYIKERGRTEERNVVRFNVSGYIPAYRSPPRTELLKTPDVNLSVAPYGDYRAKIEENDTRPRNTSYIWGKSPSELELSESTRVDSRNLTRPAGPYVRNHTTSITQARTVKYLIDRSQYLTQETVRKNLVSNTSKFLVDKRLYFAKKGKKYVNFIAIDDDAGYSYSGAEIKVNGTIGHINAEFDYRKSDLGLSFEENESPTSSPAIEQKLFDLDIPPVKPVGNVSHLYQFLKGKFPYFIEKSSPTSEGKGYRLDTGLAFWGIPEDAENYKLRIKYRYEDEDGGGETVDLMLADHERNVLQTEHLERNGNGKSPTNKVIDLSPKTRDFVKKHGTLYLILKTPEVDVKKTAVDIYRLDVTPGSRGQTYIFNGSKSTPSPGAKIVSYDWRLGDGVTAEGEVVSHGYRKDGEYDVTLTVTDSNHSTDKETKKVDVRHDKHPPVIQKMDVSTGEGLGIEYSSTATDPDEPDEDLEYRWSFGDGGTSEDRNGTYEYDEPGRYGVRLVVVDSDDLTDNASTNVSVYGGLRARFSISPETPHTGENVVFDGTNSTPSGSIVNYIWRIDGEKLGDTSRKVTQSFEEKGRHDASLEVVGKHGGNNSTARSFTVVGVKQGSMMAKAGKGDWIQSNDVINNSYGSTTDKPKLDEPVRFKPWFVDSEGFQPDEVTWEKIVEETGNVTQTRAGEEVCFTFQETRDYIVRYVAEGDGEVWRSAAEIRPGLRQHRGPGCKGGPPG